MASPLRPTLLGSERRRAGKAPPAISRSMWVTSPGPCDYVGDDRKLAHHVKAPESTFCSGPGHRSPCLLALPGPGDYRARTPERHQPSAIMGTGPGHDDAKSTQASPGPCDYAKTTTSRIRGGNYFTTVRRTLPGSQGGAAEERRQFRQHDYNRNGVLDFHEVCSLLQKGDRSINEVEVRKLFDTMDVNADGHIQLEELVSFLHSDSVKCSAWRKRLRSAFELSRPGPGDYNTESSVEARCRQAPKATIGQGPGHEEGHVEETPGPATYHSERSAVTKHVPAATIGNGPGHEGGAVARGSGLAVVRLRRKSCSAARRW
eukprot:TRINITY_DN40026_c0_g1_i1.p1 TRINITY_DN40026_c0_g1~~TRINITY_DN40026_c0_g1_i1.p1  ORF type:complete len:334 (-),score=39.80 TRINITY_DN40026_c0_g1_i1:134-1087(-)